MVAFYSGKLSNCNIKEMFERCVENLKRPEICEFYSISSRKTKT